jgi:hypothetical protein
MGIRNLKGKKGESLVLVMILMFFFMIVCVSVSAAALSGIKYAGMQQDFNQALILERSIHENIKHSLQSEADGSLGRWVIDRVISENFSEVLLTITFSDGEFTDIYNDGRITVQSILLRFPHESPLPTFPRIPSLYQVESSPIFCYLKWFCSLDESMYCDEDCEYVCYICTFYEDECVCGGFFPDCTEHHQCSINTSDCEPQEEYDPFDDRWQEAHECPVYIVCPTTLVLIPNPCRTPGEYGALEEGEERPAFIINETFTSPRIPRTRIIPANTTMYVIINIESGGTTSRSRAVYSYSGGELSDCLRHADASTWPTYYDPSECEPPPLPGAIPPEDVFCCMAKEDEEWPGLDLNIVADGLGRWEFESYENFE